MIVFVIGIGIGIGDSLGFWGRNFAHVMRDHYYYYHYEADSQLPFLIRINQDGCQCPSIIIDLCQSSLEVEATRERGKRKEK